VSDARHGQEPTDVYVLPLRVGPFPDECLPGLAMRTAARFGFHDGMRLFRRLHPPRTSLWTFCAQDPDGPLGIATRQALGLEAAAFARLALWSGDANATNVLGSAIWTELVRSTDRAVCPACLRESGHHRAAWLVTVLPACPVHGVRLVDRCQGPTCGRPLKWRGGAVHRCGNRACRFDLRDSGSEPVGPGVMGGVTALHRLLTDGGSAAPLGMPVGDAIRLSLKLGQISLGFLRESRPPGFVARERERLPMVMDEGWRVLDDWPRGFVALLERLQADASRRAGRAGLRKAFGAVTKLVHEWARQPWGAPIGAAFVDYVAARPELGATSYVIGRYAPGAELRLAHVSLAEAQAMLGISPAAMMSIARRRRMFVLEPRGSGVPAQLRAEAVEALRAEMEDFLLPEEARAVLGVGTKVMAHLEEEGLVRRIPEDERVMENRPFRRSDVVRFVSACVGGAGARAATGAAGDGPLTDLAHLLAAGRSYADLCRALSDGRIRAGLPAPGKRGLGAIRVRLEDAERALPPQRTQMTAADAGRLIGVRNQIVDGWVARGFVASVRIPGERGKRITREAWDAFQRDYVAGGQLCELFGQDDNFWLSRHLRFQGVLPVSGPDVDGASLALFRRADLTPAVIEAVRRIQARPPGTPSEKHREAFARGHAAATEVARRWGVDFQRMHNRYRDRASGRLLQTVSGRRPDLTGVFRFSLTAVSMARLRAVPGAMVALVPFQGGTFVLAPFDRLDWRGDPEKGSYVTLRFDAAGNPLSLAEYAVPMPRGDGEPDQR
jgi:hypothetical protein